MSEREPVIMGWKLAEEIACARPERPGSEWWTLLDIAQAARDETRRAMPGIDVLMDRGKCSRATVFRRLKALSDAGLLAVVTHSGPGKRAVYEIPVIHTGLNIAETRTGLSVSETRSDGNRSQNRPEQVSLSGVTGLSVSETRSDGNRSQNRPEQVSLSGVTGLSVSETPLVIQPSTLSSIPEAPVVTPSVEGRPAGSAPRLPIEYQAWIAIHPSEASNA